VADEAARVTPAARVVAAVAVPEVLQLPTRTLQRRRHPQQQAADAAADADCAAALPQNRGCRFCLGRQLSITTIRKTNRSTTPKAIASRREDHDFTQHLIRWLSFSNPN
jgi:hypothetical protein